MKTALIYPPTCDPTAPYLSVPTLTAWLRRHGHEVLPIDANLEAWEWLLRPASLAALAEVIEERLAGLEAKPALSHVDQLDYAALWAARGDAAAAPGAIEAALATLRDPEAFYDPEAYGAAVAIVEAAQRVVSAAHAPLVVDFVSYRTPFSLLSAEEIARDAAPGRDPFHDYFESLAVRLREAGVGLVGLSVAFPGQIQPAYSLAHVLRERLPGVHVTVGGPALTQMLLRLTGERLERAIGPFSSAVVFEGEAAILELAETLDRGGDPCPDGRLIRGRMTEDLGTLPPPDFDGLPLDRYLAPELILPYDPTRGCYWGTCTFCHYGLAEVGTARYRQRPVATVLDHLAMLSAKHGAKFIYLSQDVFPPKIAADIARGIADRGLDLQWGTDMRPEPSLDPALCETLVRGGLLNTALGVESAAPRVLKLIDKGIAPDDVARVVRNLAAAGAAVEAMCFTDFPTESCGEAMETVRFCTSLRDSLSLFIVGRFDLTHGSLVAQRPGEFGIKEVWQVEGDELGTGLFFAERRRAKNAAQQARVDRAVEKLASGWRLRRYPWAGALSTAHTMLWYARHGADVFRTLGPAAAPGVPGARPRTRTARFNVARLSETSASREAGIWQRLVHTDRRVGRDAYLALAEAAPRAKPDPRMFRFASGTDPELVTARPRRGPAKTHSGRRSSSALNATKRTLLALVLALFTSFGAVAEEPAAARKIEPESPLNRHKKQVFVCFRDQLFADKSAYPAFCAKHEATPRAEVRALVVSDLKKKAAGSMAAWSKNPVAGIEVRRTCWLVNGFVGEAKDAGALEAVAKREDVLFVYRIAAEEGSGMGASPGPVPADVYGEKNEDGTLKAAAEPPFTAKGLKIGRSLDFIQAPGAWASGVTGQGVVVAVFDSGVYPACGDLREAMWVNPREVAGNGKDDDGNGLVDDVFGANIPAANGDIVARELPAMSAKLGAKTSHGHMCAGMIAGRGKNGILTGVAPRARIMPVIGSTDLWCEAFEYVLDHGGDVVSMSFMAPQTEEYRGLWRRMTEHATAAGLLLCGGAGNNGQSKNPVQIFIPKDIPCVMAGAGVDLDKDRAPFSSKGPVTWEKVPFYGDYPMKGGGFLRKPDVCACATGFEGILFEGAAKTGAQGNSFSGPQIAGCAALLLEANPGIKPWQIQRVIDETAEDLGPRGWDPEFGWGLMNCRAAVEAARKLKGPGR